MKRILSLVVLLAMVLSFTACSGGTETSSPSQSEPSSSAGGSASSEADASDPASMSGTVRVWTAYSEEQGMGALVEAFNEKYPNITVELTKANNTADENVKIDTALMAGGEIDVLLSYGLPRTTARVDAGNFMELTDLIEEAGLDSQRDYGAEYLFDGKLYTLPIDGIACFVSINMTKWEEAGLGEIPQEWTWDEYLEACRAMTKDGVFGGSDYQSLEAAYYPVIQIEGGDIFYNVDGDGLTRFTSDPEFADALNRKYKAEVEDKIWYKLTDYRANGIQAQDTFLTGQTASTISTNLFRFIRDTENYPIDFKVAFAPYPVKEEGQTNYMAGIAPFGQLAVTSTCENKEASWEFAKFFATEGNIYLSMAGHLPMYKGTDIDNAVDVIFGSVENAEKLIDVESFKRVVLNYDATTYQDSVAYAECEAVWSEVLMYIMGGEMSVEDGLKEMQTRCDEIINNQ